MNKLKIKKDDKVKIITCKSKGKIGDVLKTLPSEKKLIISVVNLAKKPMIPVHFCTRLYSESNISIGYMEELKL